MNDGTPISDADPLCRMGADALRQAYASGQLSPVEVARTALDRAESIQPLFNAFTRIDRDAALAQAKASEDRWRRGAPLSAVDGVPATIKDMVWVEGWPIRYGSPSTGEVPCPQDAPAVARMRAAGITFLGLTTTPEFGWKALTDGPLSGITRNPWNPEVTPGGSSGGAAVAAATGAGVSTSDGWRRLDPRSVRLHRHRRAEADLWPRAGLSGQRLRHSGPSGADDPGCRRCPRDAVRHVRHRGDRLAAGPAVLPGVEAQPRLFEGARVGVWSAPPEGGVDPDIAAAFEAAVARLARLGATVTAIELPPGDPAAIFRTLWYAGAAARASALSPDAKAALDPGLCEIVAEGEGFEAVRYIKAMSARAEFGRAMEALASGFDIMVSPATAVLPFAVGHEVPPGSGLGRWTEWAGFSYPLNLSQQPAAVVPCGRSASGLPIALQLIGPRGADGRVLDFAKAFEQACADAFL